MRRVGLVLLLVLAASPVLAHVGSPNVFFDGQAGPYPVRVIVRPPKVIPGLAEILIRVREGKADRVTVQPVQWSAGAEGAPPPDAAQPVPGDAAQWSGQLWLMTFSSYSVKVKVGGAAGEGSVEVPVPAAPTQMLGMRPRLGWVLAGLGVFLFAGALSLVGAAVREGSLPAGEQPGAKNRTRARTVAVLAGLLLASALYGGKSWWEDVEAEKRSELYKPLHVTSAVRVEDGRGLLKLAIDDPKWLDKSWSPLMADHGKLMHLFLVREPGLDAFAHLHPVPLDRDHFEVVLPVLPSGRYRLYADVVHESGFPQTLVDKVGIPSSVGGFTGASREPDPDDSWRSAAPIATTGGLESPLEGGLSMTWRRRPEPLRADAESDLAFEVKGIDGRPVSLEPYMGMLSHAVIARDDGAVFVHLHPMGSINMAAQQLFERKTEEAEVQGEKGVAGAMPSGPGIDHAAMGHAMASPLPSSPSIVTFPYAFPQPGRYRLWVQVKTEGQVRTGVFDAEVR
jgi:hypothetical protein